MYDWRDDLGVEESLGSLVDVDAAVGTLSDTSLDVDEGVALLCELLETLLDVPTEMVALAAIQDVALGMTATAVTVVAATAVIEGVRAGGGRAAAGAGAAGGGGDLVLPVLTAAAVLARVAMAAARVLAAGVMLAALDERLQVLPLAGDALAVVNEGVAELAEDGSLALPELVVGEATGDVDEEGVQPEDGLDADGGDLDGAQELLRVHALDGHQVVRLDDDVVLLGTKISNPLGILSRAVVQGVDQIGSVDDKAGLDVLVMEVVCNASKLLPEGLVDDEGELALGATTGWDLNIGLGTGAARARVALPTAGGGLAADSIAGANIMRAGGGAGAGRATTAGAGAASR